DSFVGAFVSDDGTELGFDYGQYSNPLPDPGAPGYDVTTEEIGGKPAKLVVAREAPAVTTGVNFAEVTRDRMGCEGMFINKLTVSADDLTAEQQATVLEILRSIHFPGLGEWTMVPVPALPGAQPAALIDIDMLSSDEGWAVGGEWHPDAGTNAVGSALHYRDGSWHALPSPAVDVLWGVDMVSADEGWAVGLGTILHYANGAWQTVDVEFPGVLLDVDMVSSDDGWIVGTRALLRYRDGEWQLMDEPEFTGALKLDMLSPDSGWAIGGVNLATGEPNFHRFENGAWRPVPWPLPTLSEPLALDMSPSDYGLGWLGGANGRLARHCENRYELITTTLDGDVWDIEMSDDAGPWTSGASGTEGWAVGGYTGSGPALLAHFDDDVWTVLDSPYDGYIKSIEMVSRDEGWAVGAEFGSDEAPNAGALLHYTGPAQPPPPPGATATSTPTGPTPTGPTPTGPTPNTPHTQTPTDSPSPTATATRTPPNGRAGIYLPSVVKPGIGLAGPAGAIAVYVGKVYLGDGAHVAVVDVDDPAAPRVTDRIGPLGADCIVTDIEAASGQVYASCLADEATVDAAGTKTVVSVLRAAAAELPAVVLGSIELDEMAYALAVSDDSVCGAGIWCAPGSSCAGGISGGVIVVNARDPAGPVVAGQLVR
ncbi:MAG: hypothetical protein ACK2UL_10620, partial [Anaerolineae bacterium]